MKNILAILLVALVIFQFASAQTADLLIQTNYGKVQGSLNAPGTHRVWKGIPFAAPPVGNLRWTSPRAPAPWSGVKVANTSSLPCTQSASSATSSEDCLYLNIYAPANQKKGTLLPVIVWVYGGAYISGSNANINGSYISGEDVIFVAINYRLGMMGYFAHNSLANSADHSSGIGFYGVQDLGASLEWVRDNIRNFGGDPNVVTLGGQSAGAFAMCAFISTPKAWGLFHRLLMDSTHCTVDTQEQGLTRGNKLATTLGCGGLSDSAALTCLLGKSQSEIYTAQAAYNYGTLPYQTLTGRYWPSYWPQYNGLVDQPSQIIKKGGAPRVPMLIGNMFNESSAYNCAPLVNTNASNAESLLLSQMRSQARSEELIAAVSELYDIANAPTPIEGFNNFQTDFVYKCHASSLAQAYSTSQNVYMYVIEHTPAFYLAARTAEQAKCLGVPHGSDLNYYGYTDGTLTQLTAEELVLSAAMRKAWITFAKTGVPSIDGVNWPKYEPVNRQYVRYDVGAITTGTHLRQAECDALTAAIGGDSQNQPGFYPECTASVSLTARPGAWSSNNQNFQLFDISVTNTCTQPITAASIKLNLNGGTIQSSWNIESKGNGIYALPSWYQGFSVGSTGNSAGFILASSGALNPSVSLTSIAC